MSFVRNIRTLARDLESNGVHIREFDGMLAIATGSRVYGTPKPDSDMDIVLYCSSHQAYLLKALADMTESKEEHEREYDLGDCGYSLRFGKLNLIVTWDEKLFETWVDSTNTLKAIKPVTRDEAIKEFDRRREAAGFRLRQNTRERKDWN